MTLKPQECFELRCDGCNASFEGAEYTPHFSTAGDDTTIWADGDPEGWITMAEGDKHYCWSCRVAGKSGDDPARAEIEADREYFGATP